MKSPTDRIIFPFFAAVAASTVPARAPARRPVQAPALIPNQVILVPPHTAQNPAYTAQGAHPQVTIDILHAPTLPAHRLAEKDFSQSLLGEAVVEMLLQDRSEPGRWAVSVYLNGPSVALVIARPVRIGKGAGDRYTLGQLSVAVVGGELGVDWILRLAVRLGHAERRGEGRCTLGPLSGAAVDVGLAAH